MCVADICVRLLSLACLVVRLTGFEPVALSSVDLPTEHVVMMIQCDRVR